ncbi:PH domain-containing protein [Nocardia inohanensis]|uniref:PH domain-containing protein n=1 Tax=Nocardia inohanensis TaxID=209246 RepID=UPI000AC2121A|nr:PH domain-containing protein [Nocardia inohanensis]
MPVVRIWKRDGGSEEPPRQPAAETKAGDSEMPTAETASTPAEAAVASNEWDLEIRPHHSVRTARIVAAVLAVGFTLAGVFLRVGSTGVNFRISDQIAMAVFGFLLGGAVLLLTRPRVRVGAQGVQVRNIAGDNLFRWPDIRGISFPDKKSWARLELVHEEYVPMLAIRRNDKLRAAEAMDRFRELGAKYTGRD